jgi:hypothetical protein
MPAAQRKREPADSAEALLELLSSGTLRITSATPRCRRPVLWGLSVDERYLTIVKVSRTGVERPAELVASTMSV